MSFPSEEAEEKEEDYSFPVYSARSQQDMSAMVSALSQVIGGGSGTHNDPFLQLSSQTTAAENQPTQPATEGQGILPTHH